MLYQYLYHLVNESQYLFRLSNFLNGQITKYVRYTYVHIMLTVLSDENSSPIIVYGTLNASIYPNTTLPKQDAYSSFSLFFKKTSE